VLESFPNVRCWDNKHMVIALLSFPVLLIVTIGVPGIIIFRYRLLRHQRRAGLRKLVIGERRKRQEAAVRAGDSTTTVLADESKVVKVASMFVKRILPPRGYMRDARMYRFVPTPRG